MIKGNASSVDKLLNILSLDVNWLETQNPVR